MFAPPHLSPSLCRFISDRSTGTLAKSIIWCLVECSAGVISTCLPTLRPLIQMATGGFNTTNKSSADDSANPHVVTIGGGSSSNASRNKPRHFHRINDVVLRHDCDEGNVTSAVGRGQLRTAGSSGDEIPLNAIGVRTDVEWSEGGSVAVADGRHA
jgi:hypothetical protein